MKRAGSKPSYKEMILVAISAQMSTGDGVSQQMIAKYLQNNFQVTNDGRFTHALHRALKAGLRDGIFEIDHSTHRYRLTAKSRRSKDDKRSINKNKTALERRREKQEIQVKAHLETVDDGFKQLDLWSKMWVQQRKVYSMSTGQDKLRLKQNSEATGRNIRDVVNWLMIQANHRMKKRLQEDVVLRDCIIMCDDGYATAQKEFGSLSTQIQTTHRVNGESNPVKIRPEADVRHVIRILHNQNKFFSTSQQQARYRDNSQRAPRRIIDNGEHAIRSFAKCPVHRVNQSFKVFCPCKRCPYHALRHKLRKDVWKRKVVEYEKYINL